MNRELVWISKPALLLLHDESLAEHGGASGIRDEGLLDSALARPINRSLYEDADLASLAASYAFGLAKNHPVVDGNKRAAFLALGLFLLLNGYRLTTTQLDATTTVLSLAASEIDEDSFADWIRSRLVAR